MGCAPVSEVMPYRYCAPRPAWALRAIADAEALHGQPELTCTCGGPVTSKRARFGRPCETCDPPAPSDARVTLHYRVWNDEPACHVTGNATSTTDPRKVTCGVCLRTRALASALARQMVTS